eukprot:COSAG06_NODE_3140_length_5798_cov_9.196526_5_plen_196_part_00
MDAFSTDELKAELIRRVQSRDARWNRDPGTADVPGESIVGEAELDEMTQRLAAGVPPAALQGFRIAQITEDSISISAPLEHTWNGAGIGFAGSLATLVAYTGASMAGQANKRAGFPTANAFCAKGQIKYVDKVADPHFYATATIKGGAEAFEKFATEMREVGKTRLECEVKCYSGGKKTPHLLRCHFVLKIISFF